MPGPTHAKTRQSWLVLSRKDLQLRLQAQPARETANSAWSNRVCIQIGTIKQLLTLPVTTNRQSAREFTTRIYPNRPNNHNPRRAYLLAFRIPAILRLGSSPPPLPKLNNPPPGVVGGSGAAGAPKLNPPPPPPGVVAPFALGAAPALGAPNVKPPAAGVLAPFAAEPPKLVEAVPKAKGEPPGVEGAIAEEPNEKAGAAAVGADAGAPKGEAGGAEVAPKEKEGPGAAGTGVAPNTPAPDEGAAGAPKVKGVLVAGAAAAPNAGGAEAAGAPNTGAGEAAGAPKLNPVEAPKWPAS